MGRTLTYRELAALVDRAATGLQKLGVKPGIHVGLYLPNTPHYVISFFAILKAGGTVVNYSPLDAGKVLDVDQGRDQRGSVFHHQLDDVVGEPGAVLDAVDPRPDQTGQRILAEDVCGDPRAVSVGGVAFTMLLTVAAVAVLGWGRRPRWVPRWLLLEGFGGDLVWQFVQAIQQLPVPEREPLGHVLGYTDFSAATSFGSQATGWSHDAVAAAVLAVQGTTEVSVTVRKLHPPVSADLASAGVRVSRSRR